MSAGWMLACILAAVLLVSVICRKRDRKRKWSQVLWTVLAAVLLMAATGAVYLSMYSHHDESAEPFLISSETVAVTPASNGLMFDGPSDSRAVIFYPGAKVEADAAKDIQQEYHYDQWYMAGHSLGGVTAATYLQEHSDEFRGLILLAAYSTDPLPEELQVVSLYGDQDEVLNMEEYEKNRENLPEKAEEVIISGGNHAQFGNYGIQKGDGTAVISRENQQRQVVEALKSLTNE